MQFSLKMIGRLYAIFREVTEVPHHSKGRIVKIEHDFSLCYNYQEE